MQSIRAQRMKKIMHVQGEVGGKKEFVFKVPNNLHEILRKSKSQNIEELAIQDLTKKMLNDDFNSIRSYEILSADTQGQEKKPQFKSMHNMYDLQTLKITKLYRKKQKTSLEQDIRKSLAHEPDKQLLLSEIYEQLDEADEDNKGGEPAKHKENKPAKEESINSQQNHSDQVDETQDITQWTKRLKQSRKKGLTPSPPPRKSHRAVTELVRQPTALSKSDDKSEGSQKSIKEKMQNALKKVKEIKELQGDLSVQKQIQQYLSRPSQIIEFKASEDNKSANFDYTIEGVQRFYNIMIKGQNGEFRSEGEKAKFFKKQTQIIINKLIEKKRLDDQQLKEKENQSETFRIESHEIHERLGQIKILMEQLQEELTELQKLSGPNQMRQSRQQMIASMMSSAQKAKELEKDLQILVDSKTAYKAKLMYNRRMIDKLDQEVFERRKEKKKLHQCLVQFYYFLLKSGQDVRQTGIAWVITQLNRLGEKVASKAMPDFLDQKAKEYLLVKATILHDIEVLEQEQSESFKTYKQESADSSLMVAQKNLSMSQDSLEMSSLPSIFPADSNKLSAIDLVQARQDATKTSRNNYSLETLGPITLGLTSAHIEALESMLANLNKVNVPVTNATLIYKETQKKLKQRIRGNSNHLQQQSQQLESSMDASTILKEEAIRQYDKSNQQLNKIKQKLNQVDDEQVHRVAKEFEFKSYGKRFNIDPVAVLSCLVGGIRCDREVVKYGMKKNTEQS